MAWNGEIDPPAPPAPPQTVRTVDVPTAFDRTGGTDLTAAFQAFLDGTPNETEVVYPDGAEYWIENTLCLDGRRDLVLRSAGRTVIRQRTDGSGLVPPPEQARRWPRTRSFNRVRGCERLRFAGLVYHGAHAAAGIGPEAYVSTHEAQHVFDVAASDEHGPCADLELVDVAADHVYGDFFYVRGASRVWLHAFDFANNGRQGLAVTNGSDVLIEDGRMVEVRRALYDLEPNSVNNRIERVTIRRNVFGRHRLNALAAAGHGGFIGHVLIEDNRYEETSGGGQVKSATRRGPFVVRRNVATGVSGNPIGTAMRFTNVDGIRVTGNRQPMQRNRDMYMVGIENCTDFRVRNNDISPYGVGQWKYVGVSVS